MYSIHKHIHKRLDVYTNERRKNISNNLTHKYEITLEIFGIFQWLLLIQESSESVTRLRLFTRFRYPSPPCPTSCALPHTLQCIFVQNVAKCSKMCNPEKYVEKCKTLRKMYTFELVAAPTVFFVSSPATVGHSSQLHSFEWFYWVS